MFTLMVSFDAGMSYSEFMKSDDCKELEERAKIDDLNWTRWYIEKDGRCVEEIICPIHKNILDTIKRLSD